MLEKEGVEEPRGLPRALALDPRGADLDPADRVMIDWALALTAAPGSMTEERVLGLRRAGFDDTAILDIAQVTSYFNFVNRMAEGLGLELEGYWTPERLTLTREEFDRRPG